MRAAYGVALDPTTLEINPTRPLACAPRAERRRVRS
jgi:hypothetical protein